VVKVSYDGVPELCPHCDQPQDPRQTDEHVAVAHADIPPCTATLTNGYSDGTLRCVLRAGHQSGHGEHGGYHVSARNPIVGRTMWNDNADGSTPHSIDESGT
jgi:hypothetical protein